jgi:hypothetical protein
LNKALNAVSFGDFRVRAREARFDRNIVPYEEMTMAGVKKGVVEDEKPTDKPKEKSVIEKVVPPRLVAKTRTDALASTTTAGLDTQEGVRVGEVLVRLGDQGGKVDSSGTQKQGDALKVDSADVVGQDSRIYVRSYRTISDDVEWARCGVVATIANGEAVSMVRRRIEDAGFKGLDTLHLGGGRVLVRSLEGTDVLSVLDCAKDFFNMCFSHWVRWETAVIPFQRGAWVRIYGTPLHAWNDKFFKLCVMDCGRFLRADSYTAAKERLDYARVLIATPALAVIKKEEHLLVDGCLVEIQIIEEWGYDLGDDACLLKDDSVSKASLVADDNCRIDPEASNHVDMMVDHIAQGVVDASQTQSDDTQSVKILDRSLSKKAVGRPGDQGLFNTILEPIVVSPDSSDTSLAREVANEVPSQRLVSPVFDGHRKVVEASRLSELSPKAVKSASSPVKCKRTTSCPPASRSGLSGPWSLEWLSDHNLGDAGVIFSATKRPKPGSGAGEEHFKKAVKGIPKMKVGGLFNLKMIARLPANDRRQVMQILQKNARRRRPRGVARRSRATGSRASAEDGTSSSSVNNDWKHWVAMQGHDHAVEDDVKEVGNFIGATFKGENANMFSVLSKAGTRQRDTMDVGQGGVAQKERIC